MGVHAVPTGDGRCPAALTHIPPSPIQCLGGALMHRTGLWLPVMWVVSYLEKPDGLCKAANVDFYVMTVWDSHALRTRWLTKVRWNDSFRRSFISQGSKCTMKRNCCSFIIIFSFPQILKVIWSLDTRGWTNQQSHGSDCSLGSMTQFVVRESHTAGTRTGTKLVVWENSTEHARDPC